MTLSQEQLEWIVAEVVRRLQAGGVTLQAAAAPKQELALSERLVTLETLRGRLAGVSRLRVEAGAIVTPAVVDLLKDNQVQLVKG
ncbi:hypothetical protein Pla123a_07370 [Posidoniimonas polymericola]|uniref:Uncharacterized protein n=1 Tax=Posidoniimonas polymericola TaxID=2528002 RepID=A0A5C5ZFP7_9BACT|nr:hypothetical protein [Posidoniimonas polymericola]TWT85930.1 hypothetical protein Pla123a_07370 [Posidoniimonas polymericola]